MSYASEVLADSPLVYLKLDETSGTAMADASGNSHAGTYSGATLNQAPLPLSGSSGSVLGGASGQGIGSISSAAWMNNSAYTVECWVKPTTTSDIKGLVSRYQASAGAWLIWQRSGHINFLVSNGSDHDLTGPTLTAGTVYHLAGTYDGTTQKLYVNGSLFSSQAVSGAGGSITQDIQLGGYGGGNQSQAYVDEFAFYGTALSGTRIAAHYAAGTSGDADVSVPLATVTLAAPPPAVVLSDATVSVPLATVTFTAPPPFVPVGATVAAPVSTFTFTAPVPTVTAIAHATIAVPTVDLAVTARVFIPTGEPAPDPAPVNGIERLTTAFYDPTGRTRLNRIGQMNAAEYRDEVSQRGNGKLRIPLDDAENAAYDNIVKFTWRGHVRFGCIINSDACELAVNGRAWLDLENLPGLLGLLDQADVAPEYGLARKSSSTRRFGAMSRGGAWLKPEEWDHPNGADYDAAYPANVKRKHQDPQFLATRYAGLQWISPAPGPNVGVPGGTIAHFRAHVNVTDAGDYAVITTGDDYTEVYGDGEQLYASDRGVYFAWRQLQTIPVSLAAGVHLFTSSVENKPGGESSNVLAFVFALIKLDSQGNPTGDPILVSNETDWICTTATVGWHKGYLIGEMLEEAQDRGIPDARALTATFTDTHDSNGQPWSTEPGEYACDIETTSLADLIVTLCESGINAHVNAANMTLNLYNRMGADKYGTVEYKLAKDGGSLLSYKTAGVSTRATSVTVHLDDGTWEQVDDTAGIDAVGRREVGYSLGTATNAATARKFGLEQLAESAKPQHQFTAKASTLRGPQFYDDVNLGDSTKGPAHRGAGVTKIRALAVTVGQNGQKVDVTPDFMEDLS